MLLISAWRRRRKRIWRKRGRREGGEEAEEAEEANKKLVYSNVETIFNMNTRRKSFRLSSNNLLITKAYMYSQYYVNKHWFVVSMVEGSQIHRRTQLISDYNSHASSPSLVSFLSFLNGNHSTYLSLLKIRKASIRSLFIENNPKCRPSVVLFLLDCVQFYLWRFTWLTECMCAVLSKPNDLAKEIHFPSLDYIQLNNQKQVFTNYSAAFVRRDENKTNKMNEIIDDISWILLLYFCWHNMRWIMSIRTFEIFNMSYFKQKCNGHTSKYQLKALKIN